MAAGRILLSVAALGAAVPAVPVEISTEGPPRAVGVTERGDRIASFVVPGRGADGPDRILVEASPGTTITGFALSVSRALYYAQSDGSLWLRPEGGGAQRLGEGAAPAVSPDGRYLAYRYPDGCSGGIAVRDLAGGGEGRFPSACDAAPPVERIALDDGAQRVAFTRADEPELWVFDRASVTGLADAQAVPRHGRYWATSPVWMSDGRLVVGQHGFQRESRVVSLDLGTGEPQVLAEDVDVAHLDADPTGRRLLVSTWDNEPDPNIAVLDTDGTMTEGRRPYGSAEW